MKIFFLRAKQDRTIRSKKYKKSIDNEQNEVYNANNEEQNVQELIEGRSEKMNLKDARIKSKLSQEQASKLTDLTVRYISYLENGKRTPSNKTIKKLAKAYHLEEVDIFLAYKRTKCSKKNKK